MARPTLTSSVVLSPNHAADVDTLMSSGRSVVGLQAAAISAALGVNSISTDVSTGFSTKLQVLKNIRKYNEFWL